MSIWKVLFEHSVFRMFRVFGFSGWLYSQVKGFGAFGRIVLSFVSRCLHALRSE